MIALCCLPSISCGTLQFHDFDGALASSGGIGTSWFPRNKYSGAPAIEENNFLPSSGAMGVETTGEMPITVNYDVDFRLRLKPWFYVGTTSQLITMDISTGSGCRFYNCRAMRQTDVGWWDRVTAEDMVMHRSPSIGLLVGLIVPWEIKGVIQYDLSIRDYRIIERIYEGDDCVGCRNSSHVKSTSVVSSGIAWRHTIQLKLEIIGVAFWVETDGPGQLSAGLGMVFSNFLFEKPASYPKDDD